MSKRIYSAMNQANHDKSYWKRILTSVSEVTIISMIMVVVFGILGIFAKGEGYSDIAKIFAGAIVGSAGGSLIAEARKK
ncbi:MAG: hypothetical protein ACREBU_21775 [Nitrososphaera sp.]